MTTEMKRILVTGAAGQIGTELCTALRAKYGKDNVIATDIKEPNPGSSLGNCNFEILDVLDPEAVENLIDKYNIDSIMHMAAILSATGEKYPQLCWDVNMSGLYNILELARKKKLNRIICPSSIAAFGPETPREDTPQETILLPKTMYGVTKVAGELLCDYYVKRFNIDVRGLRYPGIISSETLPGGGTTDYAVAIYYDAVKHGRYTCFVKEDTRLPMMYMPDCIKATIDLAEADLAKLKHHSNFNVGSMSFSAGELADSIKKYIPSFSCDYNPDYRQDIADTWPMSINDAAAREEWGWNPEFDLDSMTRDMIAKLKVKLEKEGF